MIVPAWSVSTLASTPRALAVARRSQALELVYAYLRVAAIEMEPGCLVRRAPSATCVRTVRTYVFVNAAILASPGIIPSFVARSVALDGQVTAGPLRLPGTCIPGRVTRGSESELNGNIPASVAGPANSSHLPSRRVYK